MAINDDEGTLADLLRDVLLPLYQAEQEQLDYIDRWARWDHDDPHAPRASTTEYKELIGRSQTPWLSLVVTATAQSLYVEGYRDAEGNDSPAWEYWQRNGMDRRQMAIHRAAVGYGSAYTTVLPGKDPITGESIPVIRGYSPREMMAFYDLEELDADWPEMALRVINVGDNQRRIKLYTPDNGIITMTETSTGDLTVINREEHGTPGLTPVVRYANILDLEGRTVGEVEPYISVAARIDQTSFDRLVTQRFSSWIVRTVTGMSEPETDEEGRAVALQLRQEDLLVAESPDTKFGHLPASDLQGFINSKEADIRDLAAVTQVPPHQLIGQVSNLSAEALAGAEAAHARKVDERRHSFGESHEQTLRLAAAVAGDMVAARDIESQVRWKDVESRSLAQTADALGKLAQMLQVPPKALWERIPGVTQQDVAAWEQMAEEDAMSLLAAELTNGLTAEQPGVPGAQPTEPADTGTGLV